MIGMSSHHDHMVLNFGHCYLTVILFLAIVI